MPQHFDIVVVGGGLAGAALALALAPTPLKVAVIEGGGVQAWPELEESVYDYDPRVSALTEASCRLLAELGCWEEITARRAYAYREMEVWDAEGTGLIHFSADEVRRPALGHIVENRLVLAALHQRLQESGVAMLFGATVETLQRGETGTELVLADGRIVRGALVVAADGARSRVRDWAGFHMREWDYHHHAIACTVECQQGHGGTAWQRFLPGGPLAFLPLADGADTQHYCSIVWSVRPARCEALMALDDDAFCSALAEAFEHRLGGVLACGRRFSFPLRQRHAPDYVRDGVVLVGDAAHTIHPLAGQGINLGFADVNVLAQELTRAADRGVSVTDAAMLARYQRRRKGDNLSMMALMETFQHLFESSSLPVRLLRNAGMSWLNTSLPLKRQLIARAMGL